MELSALLAAMLATLGGCLALLLGIAVLLLPLLTPELSRPRDAFWGAVVLLLGLVLVTSSERLTGAPMLTVLCGGLLIGRLGGEVGRGRWNQLSAEERAALATPQRWASGLEQLMASVAGLTRIAQDWLGILAGWLAARRQPKTSGKRWVRREAEPNTSEASANEATTGAGSAGDASASEAGAATAATSQDSVDTENPTEPSPRSTTTDGAERQAAAEPGAAAESEAGDGPQAAPGSAAAAVASVTAADPAASSAHRELADPQPAQATPGAPDLAPPEAPDLAPEGIQEVIQEAIQEEAPEETSPVAQDQEPAVELLEEVEAEVLDPPPPQRHVADFHAIEALLCASGALPPTGEAEPPGLGAEPPLAEAELEPEEGANPAAATGAPRS